MKITDDHSIPFAFSRKEKYEFQKSANKPYDLIFTNNRVQAYYVGITGRILNNYNFESRFSFSKNWGRIDQPLSELFQNSFYFKINKHIPQIIGGINGFISVAGDFGDLLNQNIAIQIGFKKTWNSFPFISHPTHKHNFIH